MIAQIVRQMTRKNGNRRVGVDSAGGSHLVFAELVRVEALQPLLQPLGIGRRAGLDGLGVVDDRLLDEDGRPGAQRQRNGVARSGVDGHRLAAHRR